MTTFTNPQDTYTTLTSQKIAISLFFLALVVVLYLALTSSSVIMWSGLISVVLFYLLIFAVGVWASRKANSQTESLILADRKLPLWIAVLTMAATWLGGGYINGTAEAAYDSGLVWVQAPWGYGLSLIIGGLFFARKMRRHNYQTLLDPLVQRYGFRRSSIFSIPAILGEIFWIAAILTALGTTFSVIIGIDTKSAILLSAFIAILYTTIGGLWSVAYTDVLQLVFLVLGLGLAIPYLLDTAGGLQGLWMQYSQKFGASALLIPDKSEMGDGFWQWIDIGLLLIFGGIPWQVYFQRVLAARSERAAMWLSIFAGVICMVVAIPAALIGMIGAITDWSAMGLSGPETPASILPYVFAYLTPEVIAVFGLGAIAAAVMSSIDSSILSAATLTTWHLVKPFKKKPLNTEDAKKTLRRYIIIIGVVAAIISLRVESVYALWYLCSDFVYCLLFPALVTALFDPKSNTIGVLCGFGVALVLRLGGGDSILGIPVVLPYPLSESGETLFPYRTFAMLTGLLTSVIVSRLSQKRFPARSLVILDV